MMGFLYRGRDGGKQKKDPFGDKTAATGAPFIVGLLSCAQPKILKLYFLKKSLPCFILGIANTYQPVGCSSSLTSLAIDTLMVLKKVKLLSKEKMLPSECLVRTYTASHAGLDLMCVFLHTCCRHRIGGLISTTIYCLIPILMKILTFWLSGADLIRLAGPGWIYVYFPLHSGFLYFQFSSAAYILRR